MKFMHLEAGEKVQLTYVSIMTPSPIMKAYYSTPEGQIHYRYLKSTLTNVTKSLVVMLHMSACSSLYFVELIERLAAEGHEVYAWDMPGFGNSYDIDFKPDGIIYYVDKIIIGVKHWGLSKFHVLGHHSGASIATELAAIHGDQVLSLTIVGPALLTAEEQVAHLKEAGLNEEVVPFNKPVADGSHLLSTWNQLLTNGEWDPEVLNGQTLDTLRAWKGRLQIYRNVFSQPAL
ncbi:alpha/beta-hydrolase [Stipitochalara longipes BDJ]|nr:alpha/beta-hydrolase [Stipitochalara longipes BDJ]